MSGYMNQGNWGALIQGVPQGIETAQNITGKDIANQQGQAYANQASLRAGDDYRNYNQLQQQQNPGAPQTTPQSMAQSGQVFDPVRERIHGMLQAASAKYHSVFGGGAQGQTNPPAAPSGRGPGPAAQSTTQPPANAPMSAPQPTSSNDSSGQIGSTGPMPLPDRPQTQGSALANGGAIPGRKLAGIRAKKAKPGNQAKPTQGERQVQAAQQPGGQPPQMAGGPPMAGPPRNTEPGAGISNQDPDLSAADGKFIQKAIKKPGQLHKDLGVPQGEKIPKEKIKAAEKGGGKVAQRARFADTLSKFKDGGMPKLPKLEPGAAPEPKPAPNAVEHDVSNDGMRHYLGKTIKRFDDGGKVPTPAGAKPEDSDSLLSINPETAAGAQRVGGAISDWYSRNSQPLTGEQILGSRDTPDPTPIPQPKSRFMDEPTSAGNSPPQTSGASAQPRGEPEVYPEKPGTTPVFDTPTAEAVVHGLQTANAAASAHAGSAPDGQPGQPTPPAPHTASTGGQNAPAPQGPPAPNKIDFSQVQVDHSQIPTTTTDDWKKIEQSTALHYAAYGMGAGEAMRKANADVTGMQHDNFMDYLRQGAALDAAGNKQGAMAAYKTAYQYFPTGHDMHFGVGPDGNIVAFGVNEQTGQPVQNGAIRLDQQAVHGIMTHFANPENFINEGVRMQTLANETAKTGSEIGLQHAQAQHALAGAHYLEERNPTYLAAAQARAAGRGGPKQLDPDTEKFYAGELDKRGVQDPDALGLAGQIESQLGHAPSSSDRARILAVVQHAYGPGVSPEERDAYLKSVGLSSPAPLTSRGSPVPNRYDDPTATFNALNSQ